MTFEPGQWALLALAAVLFGFSKTGIPGISILSVGILANLMPAKLATGVVLPLLIFADIFAFYTYRKNLEWRRVGGLLPWAVGGVALGWLALGRIDDRQTARLVGAIIALMLALQVWRRWRNPDEAAARAPAWFGPVMGLFAGVTTMIANAAGPVMTLYLLAMRLGKLELLGTGAAFFLLINWIKVPFAAQLGIINGSSLTLNLWLLPAVALGALLGRPVVERVNQRLFESLALCFAALAAGKLLLS
ncbi:MAG: sulfite exporter TauE/SafE family protein [Verrucomicrobiota bacterium]